MPAVKRIASRDLCSFSDVVEGKPLQGAYGLQKKNNIFAKMRYFGNVLLATVGHSNTKKDFPRCNREHLSSRRRHC